MLIPKARKVADGYAIRLRVNGETMTVRASSLRSCQQKAALAKAQMLTKKKRPSNTISELMDDYIEKRTSVLSPSTIRGYRTIQRTRFKDVINSPIGFDWQPVINQEARLCSPKTLKNAWGFVSSVLAENGMPQKVRLPQPQPKEREFLQPNEIPLFLEAIKGDLCERQALLALHGLRRSEILAIRQEDVRNGRIYVHAALVPDENGQYIRKTTKTVKSTRVVPVLIPRLEELPYTECCAETIFRRVNRACVRVGLPPVGLHGLRHTFASLCYSLRLSELETQRLGGWSDPGTMRKIYTHLAERDRSVGEAKLALFFAENSPKN